MHRFDQRNVLVTGGSSGIGRATVLRFASEGATVVAAGRDRERLDEVVAAGPAGRITAELLDVRDTGAVREVVRGLVERLGRLHVLVNCAGVSRMDPVLELDEADWHDTLQTNLTGAFVASQEAARHMAEAGGGAIVNVASVDAVRGRLAGNALLRLQGRHGGDDAKLRPRAGPSGRAHERGRRPAWWPRR